MRTLLLLAALAACTAHAASWTEQRADLLFARDQFVPKSLAYSASDRRQATAFINRLVAGGRPLSDPAFLLDTLRITAFAHNAHEAVHGGWMPSTRLPIRMIWFPDAIVVARAAPQWQALLGGRVERIEGLAPARLRTRLRPYFGGTDDHLRWNGLWLVESGGMLNALGVARQPDRIRLRVRKRDRRVVEVVVPFVPREAAAAGVSPPRLWSGAPYPSEAEHGWTSAIDPDNQPLYLRDDDEPFRVVLLRGLDALYVQFRANSTAEAGGRDIAAFTQRVRDAIAEEQPDHLVLDLRFDIGGDIDRTRDLARDMVKTVPGRIFVLTGPYTFSAGLVFAAAVKHDGGARVTLVGEPVADRLRFWSEGSDVCLPNSRHCLRASDGLWDLRRGCAGERGCYGDRLDARVGSLDPQVRAPLTSLEWLSQRDPAMEAVGNAIRSLGTTAIRGVSRPSRPRP